MSDSENTTNIKKDESTSINTEDIELESKERDNVDNVPEDKNEETEEPDTKTTEAVSTEIQCLDNIKLNIEDEKWDEIVIPQPEDISGKDIKTAEMKYESDKGKRQRSLWVFHFRHQPQPRPQEFQGYGFPPKIVMAMPQAEAVGGPMSYDSDRNSFVRIVMSMCAVMLLFTVVYVYIAHSTNSFRKFMRSLAGLIVFICCTIVTIIISYVYCCSDCSRIFPINILLNIIATCCYSYIVGFIAIRYAPYIVLCAAGVTLLVTLVCVGLAFTSFDFTRFILIIIIAMVALAVSSLIVMLLSLAFGVKLTVVRLIILVISSVVSSVMLVIELQMILGGKSVEIGEEEYALGAYMVYTSIINLFLTFLRIAAIAVSEGDLDFD